MAKDMTPGQLAMIRECASLLDPPAPEVVVRLADAVLAAWAERDERRAEAEGLRDRVVEVVGERDALRTAIRRFAGVLVTDSGTVLSRRVREAVDALIAVATGETH